MRIQLQSFLACMILLVPFVAPVTAIADVNNSTPVGTTVVIDAGHGGPDSGARGRDIHEKAITLAVARDVAKLLREAGWSVVETRVSDHDLSTVSDKKNFHRHRGDLRGRLKIVRHINPDVFVSIHCNSGPSPAWRGAQVLYLTGNEKGQQLAKIMQNQFKQDLLPTGRNIEANQTLYLLKRINGPTVLAEIGFLTNPEEAQALNNPEYQQKIAFSIYVSILKYFDVIVSMANISFMNQSYVIGKTKPSDVH